MIARLVECSDYNIQYGILIVYNASLGEVQNKIYEIKNKFCEEEFDEWCIDDVFAKFPEEWKWDYVQTACDEAIEI